jgi:putative membrane protein
LSGRQVGQQVWPAGLVGGPLSACHDEHMKSFVIRVLVNGVALWVAAFFVKGIHLADGAVSTTSQIITILWVALIFGLLNALIKPILTILSLPVIVLTLGLFTLIVNAAMLELTSWFAGQFNLDFHVDQFFWDAVIGALIITVVSMILNAVLPDGD